MLPRAPDKQSVNLIANGSVVQRTAYLERVMDPELSLSACQKADGNAMWMLEKLLDLPGAAERWSSVEDGYPTNQLILESYQQAHASLSTGAGGFGPLSAEARRMSPSVGSLAARVPEVLAELSGAIGDKVRRKLPAADLVRRM